MSAYTEVEARKKWCPLVRVVTLKGNVDMGPIHATCYASDCMMWQWSVQEFQRDMELWSKEKNKRVTSAWGDDADWRPVGQDKDSGPPPAIGYCGRVGA